MSVDGILRSHEFFDISMEFSAIGHYLDLVEGNLPSITEVERKEIREHFSTDDDESEQIVDFLEYELDAGITTRFFEAGGCLAVWGAYERGLQKVAGILAEAKKIPLRPKDLKGSPRSAKKYFDRVLGFSLHPDGTDWDRIGMIYCLRNCLAHENGRLLSYASERARKLEKWSSAQAGAQVVDGYVVLSCDFVRATLKFLQQLIDDLIRRVEKALEGSR